MTVKCDPAGALFKITNCFITVYNVKPKPFGIKIPDTYLTKITLRLQFKGLRVIENSDHVIPQRRDYHDRMGQSGKITTIIVTTVHSTLHK